MNRNRNSPKRRQFSKGRNNDRPGKPRQKSGSATAHDYRRMISIREKQPETKEFVSMHRFSELELHPQLKRNLAAKGYEHPTEIQETSMDYLMKGRNMIGVANTGTGKTGAFLLPLIQRLLMGQESGQTLVVVPTRELALQVEAEFKSLTKGMDLYVTSLIGGTSVSRDIAKLRRKNHLIVGTPGRLMDMAGQGALHLNRISVLILDEFDRMLDMGFVHEIKRMIGAMHNRSQTMLFSATIDHSQRKLIDEIVPGAIELKVSSGATAGENIDQNIIEVKDSDDKFGMLLELLNNPDFDRVILFAETKRVVDRLSKKLHKSGIATGLIHGDKSQNFRTRAIKDLKNGAIRVLVATDVAARGLDIDNISHVINYQQPQTMDSYLHRIGRTGRAGKKGTAYTFITD